MKKASNTPSPDAVSVVTGQLAGFFQRYPADACLVAYSGGLDSHVLLHGLVHLSDAVPLPSPHPNPSPRGRGAIANSDEKPPRPQSTVSFETSVGEGVGGGGVKKIRAIHINHNLQPESADWAEHCRQVCTALSIELEVVSLQLQVPSGSSIEAIARTARYQAFSAHLQPGEALLTAHHQDDQAETLLLNLLRGAGTAGLAAMPESRVFADTRLLRPLLGLSREQLQDYAHQQQLSWIEDPSNASVQFDRNYLRHAVMPALTQRWPAAAGLLARAAQWQGETAGLMQDLLADKLQQVQGTAAGTLSVSALLSCTPVLQKALLRRWLRECGFSMPSAKKLQHVLHDMLTAKADAQPCVRWPECEMRRYRDDLYALSPLPAHDPQQIVSWPAPYHPLTLDSLRVCLEPQVLGALLPELLRSGETLKVCFRRGGEKVLRSGVHISLKQLLQDKGIPPWQRDRLPLIYRGQQLLVVPGLFGLAVEDLEKR